MEFLIFSHCAYARCAVWFMQTYISRWMSCLWTYFSESIARHEFFDEFFDEFPCGIFNFVSLCICALRCMIHANLYLPLSELLMNLFLRKYSTAWQLSISMQRLLRCGRTYLDFLFFFKLNKEPLLSHYIPTYIVFSEKKNKNSTWPRAKTFLKQFHIFSYVLSFSKGQ